MGLQLMKPKFTKQIMGADGMQHSLKSIDGLTWVLRWSVYEERLRKGDQLQQHARHNFGWMARKAAATKRGKGTLTAHPFPSLLPIDQREVEELEDFMEKVGRAKAHQPRKPRKILPENLPRPRCEVECLPEIEADALLRFHYKHDEEKDSPLRLIDFS